MKPRKSYNIVVRCNYLSKHLHLTAYVANEDILHIPDDEILSYLKSYLHKKFGFELLAAMPAPTDTLGGGGGGNTTARAGGMAGYSSPTPDKHLNLCNHG